jgi:SAM-dependent methyltransferase
MNKNYLRGSPEHLDTVAYGWLNLFDDTMWDQFLTVLDIGCGDGRHAHWWGTRRPFNQKEEFAPFTQCKAIDLFEPSNDYKNSFEFSQGDYHKLPWSKHTFDIVWSHYSLQYSTNPHKALWEWRRVLKPDGRLYLTVPSHDYWFKDKIYHSVEHNWGTTFTLANLIYMLALCGYDTSQGCYYKSKKDPFIRIDVPVNSKLKKPLDNLETSLYDLIDMSLLPPHLEQAVSRKGILRDEDFIITWSTGLVRDFRSDY